jgi:hypothetical protein
MSRAEFIALGISIMLVALTALTVGQKIPWYLVFAIGAIIAIRPFWMDWWYGKYRPSRRELDVMPAAEYRKRCSNRKFRRWSDRVFPKQAQKPFDPNDF